MVINIYIYIWWYDIYYIKNKNKNDHLIVSKPKSSPHNKLSPNKPNSLKEEMNVMAKYIVLSIFTIYSTIYIRYIFTIKEEMSVHGQEMNGVWIKGV